MYSKLPYLLNNLQQPLFNPLEPMVPLSSLVLKENASFEESMRNLDAKCEVQGLLALFAANAKKSNNSKLYSVHNGSIYDASRIENM